MSPREAASQRDARVKRAETTVLRVARAYAEAWEKDGDSLYTSSTLDVLGAAARQLRRAEKE